MNSTGTFKVVRCYDPAIDDDSEGAMMGAYAMHRDMSKLRFVDPGSGVLPMIFHTRQLTLPQRRYVTDAASDAEQRRRAFAYGVIKVENADLDGTGDHRTFEPRTVDGGRAMPDSDLERFAEDDVQEIGLVVRARSFLPRGVPLRLLVLPSSRDACMAVLFRSAEQRLASESP